MLVIRYYAEVILYPIFLVVTFLLFTFASCSAIFSLYFFDLIVNKMDSISLKARATFKERAARERLQELTERSVQIFVEEEEQSIDHEAAAEGGA